MHTEHFVAAVGPTDWRARCGLIPRQVSVRDDASELTHPGNDEVCGLAGVETVTSAIANALKRRGEVSLNELFAALVECTTTTELR